MKQIQMPAKDFEKLKKTVEWYDAMPAFIEVGDRFHENVSEAGTSSGSLDSTPCC